MHRFTHLKIIVSRELTITVYILQGEEMRWSKKKNPKKVFQSQMQLKHFPHCCVDNCFTAWMNITAAFPSETSTFNEWILDGRVISKSARVHSLECGDSLSSHCCCIISQDVDQGTYIKAFSDSGSFYTRMEEYLYCRSNIQSCGSGHRDGIHMPCPDATHCKHHSPSSSISLAEHHCFSGFVELLLVCGTQNYMSHSLQT